MSMEGPRDPSRRSVLKGIAGVAAGAALGAAGAIPKPEEEVPSIYSKHMKEGGMEKTARNSFDRQFANKERIETAGGTAEVVDIHPEHAKNDVPVLFAPAWACTLPVYKPALETLVKEGRRTVSLNHPRTGGSMQLTEEEQTLVGTYPTAEVRKAKTLLDIVHHKQLGQLDAIAHSEGAVNVAIAALLEPEKFRNIVFFGPAGLIGEDTLSRLMQGFAAQGAEKPTLREIPVSEEAKQAAEERGQVAIAYPAIEATDVSKAVGAAANREAPWYMAKNPVRAFSEGWALSQVQIHDLIAKLHEKGIGIVIMSGVDDSVFPTEKMATFLRKGTIDGFLSVRGGHGQIGETPERYMVAAEQMLEALERKRSAR